MQPLIRDRDGYPVDTQMVLRAYAMGCFPMAEERSGRLAWFRPQERAIITWDRLRCPRSLRKVMAKQPYTISADTHFSAVMDACAARQDTWISHDIQRLFEDLHRRGLAHCIAAHDPEGRLVGGCYGLALGGIFCGESMFHRAPDASKICVYHLLLHLRQRGFIALDCQQQTPHMQRFGAYEIDDSTYQVLLQRALDMGTLDWGTPDWDILLGKAGNPDTGGAAPS